MRRDRAAYQRKYYQENRDRLVEKRRENYEKNKEHYQQYQNQYRVEWKNKKAYLGAYIDKDLVEEFKEKLKENEMIYTDFLLLAIRKYLKK